MPFLSSLLTEIRLNLPLSVTNRVKSGLIVSSIDENMYTSTAAKAAFITTTRHTTVATATKKGGEGPTESEKHEGNGDGDTQERHRARSSCLHTLTHKVVPKVVGSYSGPVLGIFRLLCAYNENGGSDGFNVERRAKEDGQGYETEATETGTWTEREEREGQGQGQAPTQVSAVP